MRNFMSAIVNWLAALFAVNGGAPHPVVATDAERKPERRAARGAKRRRQR